jgi:hypothetical protein
MPIRNLAAACFISSFILLPIPSFAEERLSWPDHRGPTFDGRAAEEDARGLPKEWDEKSGKNIAWQIDLDG